MIRPFNTNLPSPPKNRFLQRILTRSLWLIAAAFLMPASQAAEATDPLAVPTFESIGLYWKPVSGASDNTCSVHYRASGETTWKEALPLWFDPTDHPDMAEHSREYRGSIVHLKSGTTYDIKLRLAKDGTEKLIQGTTWNESLPVAKTVIITATTPQPLVLNEGGSKETGYVLYTCEPGVVLDGKDEADDNIQVNASYVILRGLTLKKAKQNGIRLGDVQDVIIEKCDISGWGRIGTEGFGLNLDAAVYSRSKLLERIIVQDCSLHHPRSNANSWTEERAHDDKRTKHPIGPQGITFHSPKGNLVIRRNKIYSDPGHKFNDGMGEVKNFSYAGFPSRDSDIYHNEVSNAWDDGLEIEGSNMNVRVWSNTLDDVYGGIGAATTSLGPLYIFRNLMNSTRKGPLEDADSNKGSYFVKLGTENQQWAKGKMYIFHNTLLQSPPRFGFEETTGAGSGIFATGDKKYQINILSRNNILFVRTDTRPSIRDAFKDPTNDYNFDLYNGNLNTAEGQEINGIRGRPQYDTSTPGRYPLMPGTPGVDAGERLPNFNDDFAGKAPDIGAFESSEPVGK